MKNKFYLLKKPRTFIFVQIMLAFGLFTGSLQAQTYTHTWIPGTIGNWDELSNWYAGDGTTMTASLTTPSSTSVVQINSGTCSIVSDSFTKTLIINNSAAGQGKLIITSDKKLTLSAPGGTGTNLCMVLRGGLIENNGTIDATVSAQNGSAIRFENPRTVTAIEWGIIGMGKIVLKNTQATTLLANGGLINFANNDANSIVPKLFLNSGSTATTTRPGTNDTYALFNLAIDSDVKIQGTGITSPAIALFKLATGSTLEINSGVTLTGTTTLATSTAGTINNSGTIISSGLINNTGTINNVGSGTLINKALTLVNNPTSTYVFTTTSTTLGALAIGDTYTVGGVTYTVAAARLINAATSVLIVTTAPTFSKPPSAGDLTIVSSATGSATIPFTAVTYNPYGGYLSSTTSVDNVVQERYLSSNQRGWRLLSNPLAATTYGAVATGSTTPLTLGNGTAKTYDSATNTWTVSNTDDTQTWDSQAAVSLFVRGRTSEVTSTTYSVSPPSNVTVSVTGTASNAVPTQIATTAGQYYLVANPYTAPVSVSSILGASSSLSSTISYYNPTVGSSGSNADLILKYGGYNNPIVSGAAGSTTDVIIPPMGAFFVQATSDGTINVPKTAIFTGTPITPSQNYTHKTAQTKVATTNDLKVEVNSEGTYYDTVAIRFKKAGDAGSNIDFGKLPNTVLDAYSIAGANKMAVSELELKEQLIPLGISSTIQKSYSFKVVENTIPAGYEAVLVDTYLNKNTVMTAGTSYSFAIDTNPASQGDARFTINLKTAGTLGEVANALDATIQVYPNPSRGQFNITNTLQDDTTIEISSLNGQRIHTQKLNSGTTTIQTKSWATGVYILKASSNGTETTKKLIIQ